MTLLTHMRDGAEEDARAAGRPAPRPKATWGHHLILDISACPVEVATDPELLRRFVQELVETIGMKAYGDPLMAHFAEHEPELAGWTLIQLIETSSITAHFVDLTGDCFLDIFSCQDFDTDVAIALVRERLSPEDVTARKIARRA